MAGNIPRRLEMLEAKSGVSVENIQETLLRRLAGFPMSWTPSTPEEEADAQRQIEEWLTTADGRL